ncbi:MAG: rod shape-determining protein MreD [Phycisphaerae bacterium]|nr:rod shape-determining protein MreD [Phycisphaerae bacterium]
MRWIPFLIFAWLFILIQMTLGKILTFDRLEMGPVGPDLLALMAVFVAMNVRNVIDGMLAGWALGFLLDLTTAGGAGGVTCVGPMAISYAVGVWMVFRLRETVFLDRALPQIVFAGLFCLVTHVLWVTAQSVLGSGEMSLGDYGGAILQVLICSLYTALLMPLVYFLLSRIRGWLIIPPPTRSRSRRSRQ